MKSFAEAFGDVFGRIIRDHPPENGDYIDPEDGYLHCGKCRGRKQYRVEITGQVFLVPVPCECRQREIEAERQEKQRMRVLTLKSEGFDDPMLKSNVFEADASPESVVSLYCRNYVEDFDRFYAAGKGILFYGPVGTGKTFYASCIANAIMEKGRPALVTSLSRYIRGMENGYGNRNELIDHLRRFDLVVFDDFGIERNTPYMNELVYALVDGRVRSEKPMIVTTNLTMDELKRTDGIAVESARIYDRILKVCVPVPVDGANVRRQQARDEYREFKRILEGKEDAADAVHVPAE